MEKHLNFLIESLGCKVNYYEGESIANTLESRGYKFFDKNQDSSPDIVIINTCAVTKTSVSKDRKYISSARRKYPNAVIAVMGCYANFGYEEISSKLGADIVIGTQHRDKLVDLIEEYLSKHKTIVLKDEEKERKYENLSLKYFHEHTRAYVKIQDGCNNFCSYCLIPFVRGRSRSRAKEDIIKEINDLVKNGYKEVVLTGIDMSSYGLDNYQNYTFSSLIEDICINCKHLYRLRISSIEESRIDEKFIELLQKYDVIANHLHIPLQSGSKKIEELMRRKYNPEVFISKIKKIREVRPDIALSTDIIVGFPQEDENDFLDTFNFAKEIKFSKIHVFPYSPREGTIAARLSGQISLSIKKERVNKLIGLSNELAQEYDSLFKGKELDFLFETEEDGYFVGHSSNFLEVKVTSSEDLRGQIRKVIYK